MALINRLISIVLPNHRRLVNFKQLIEEQGISIYGEFARKAELMSSILILLTKEEKIKIVEKFVNVRALDVVGSIFKTKKVLIGDKLIPVDQLLDSHEYIRKIADLSEYEYSDLKALSILIEILNDNSLLDESGELVDSHIAVRHLKLCILRNRKLINRLSKELNYGFSR